MLYIVYIMHYYYVSDYRLVYNSILKGSNLMNKKLIIFTSLISLSIFIAGCGSKQAVQPTSNTISNQTNTKSQTKPQELKPSSNNTVTTPKNTSTTKPSVAKITTTTKSTATKKSTSASTIVKPVEAPTINYADISAKTKKYIISGQGNIPDAGKIIWNTTLLNRVDMKSLYDQYLSNKGTKNDIIDFAKYITINAPIQSDWKELFEKALYSGYGEKVVRYKYIGGDMYQAYIMSNGKEIPFVGVSSRTGRFHG